MIMGFLISVGAIILLIKLIYTVVNQPKTKWYIRLKWHIKELNKTLSNQPSHYSSKRIERMCLFISANITVDYYTYIHIATMTVEQVLMIFGAKMVYAGFQTKQIYKDKIDETKNGITQ